MEGKIRTPMWIQILVIVLFLFVISSQNGLLDTKIAADSTRGTTRALDELEWIQTTELDFLNGTAENVEITSPGEIKLETNEKHIEDNFFNESKFGNMDNIFVDTLVGEVKLLTNDDIIFNKTFGGNYHDSIQSIQETSDGGYILGGFTGYDGVNGDFWLIKTDSFGNEIWSNSYGGSAIDKGFFAQETADGGYIITGYTESYGSGNKDYWLVKTNSLGNEQWNKTFGGSVDDWGMSVRVTSDNGYIIAGWTYSFGSGQRDIWLIKTDSLGIEQWSKTFGGSGDDEVGEVESLQITSDGGYIIVGGTDSFNAVNKVVWLLKTDSLGNEQWNKTFGGSTGDMGHSVQATSDGGYLLIGLTKSYSSGLEDIWLIKTDNIGNEQWNETYGGSSWDRGYSVQVTADGDYLLGGYTKSFSEGRNDGWLLLTNSSGIEKWNKTFGGEDNEEFYHVLQTSDNNYIAVGTITYGPGYIDTWLIKNYSPENIPPSSGEFSSINLLNSQEVYMINSFSCDTNMPSGTGLKVQFSQDNTSWYDSSGILNNWGSLSEGNNQIDLSSLEWSGPSFYYKMNFTSINTSPPKLQNINLLYSQYLEVGTFESQPFDSNTFPYWKILNWTSMESLGTEIKFQIRTSGSLVGLYNYSIFVGPDGTYETYYSIPGQNISGIHERDRFIQYKAYLSTANKSITPVLEEVSIIYQPIDTDDDDIEDFLDLDDDDDGIPDSWESQYGFDTLNQSDASVDSDQDGLNNLQEYLNESLPYNDDTDGDNLGDGFEVIFSMTEPSLWDTNNNGLGDGLEFLQNHGYWGMMEGLPDDWIGMTISWENYTLFIKTNSSVLEGEFEKDERKLTITVSGEEGTIGVTEIYVPKGLCEPEDIEIQLDGELINYTITENETYYHIHIEYNHSTHVLSADFSQVVDGDPPEILEEEEGYPIIYIIAILAIIILSIIILLGISKVRNGLRNNNIPEIPPEELSKMLEEKYSKGDMSEETYNDIKSLLEEENNGKNEQE